jgi:ketosteroid isomerase-like protein
MKYLYSVSFFLLISSSAFAQHTTPPASVTECTQLFFKTLFNEDATAMRSLFTSDFTLVSFDGQLVDGVTFANELKNGILVFDTGQVTSSIIRLYGDTGIVTGTWMSAGTLQEKSFKHDVAYTLVCVQQGAGWKIASIQFTLLPE